MNDKLDKSNVEQEYDDIENKKLWKIVLMSLREESDKLTKSETFEHARNNQNKSRNRYRDVLPYDSTRVKLTETGSSDYINASYVNLANNKYGRKYILTQGPLGSTVSHFWLMVWQENSSCIVMLNKVLEKDTIKCAQYFPTTESENESHVYSDVDLSVSLIESTVNKSYIKRVFNLQNFQTQENREIIQFHYQSWPDFGVPVSSELFLQFLWDVRASGGLNDPNKPPIVHCSAGIGRSGTFVLIDFALLQIADENSTKSLNLQQILIQLRQCRIGLIQTAEQLRFAYSSVIIGAKAILNTDNKSIGFIKFEDQIDSVEESSMHSDVSTEDDTDSDFHSNSDSNSALDKAAAAVRTRRGLPPTNILESSLVISQNNYNNDVDALKSDNTSHQFVCSVEQGRKLVREIRCNRTRQMIEDIRTNMRRHDLERERILFRLGLNRLANSLTRQNRNSVIAGASVFVGFLSLACGYLVYRYVG